MRLLVRTLAWLFRALLRTRNDLAMENMALRQQLSVYGQLKVKPRLKTEDRVFWVLFSMGYRSWRTCLRFVQPRTVLRWHAAGFKIFWRKKCEKTGRPRIPKQHQDLIRQMSIDEPGWGADRIADELRLKLGIRHAASTVQKYMVRPEHRTRTGQTWRTLMKNHKDEIWSCDFLVQHTALFSVVYIFIIMEISTRKIIGFNVTSGLYPARREIATGHSAARAGSQSVEQTALGLWVLYGAKVVSEHASAVDLVAWDGYCAARNAKNLSGVWHFGVG